MKRNISINHHSSIKIEGEKTIYFDPYEITKETYDADVIFITHNHYDHLDTPSIEKVKNDNTLIVMPNNCIKKLKKDEPDKDMTNYIGVNPSEQYNIANLNVETIKSYNNNKDFHPESNDWVGYIVTINGDRIYVAGDTDITKENKKVKCDIAFLPIGGTYTMTPEEAAELANIIKPKVAIPTHYASIVGKKADGDKFKFLLDKSIECKLLIK